MITINTMDLDWITATTDNENIFRQWEGMQTGSRKPSRHQNYRGFEDESGMFVGWGKQSKMENLERVWYDHFCIKVSGYMSRNYERLILMDKVRVTRVDVQITVNTSGYDCVEVLAEAGMMAKAVGIIDTRKEGEGTLDYGVRKGGDRYTRLYLKNTDGGLMSRIEVELKNKGSRDFCSIARTKGMREAKVWALRKSINKMNLKGVAEFERVMGEFSAICGYTDAKPEKFVKPEQKTLQWLEVSVLPCIERIANDHDTDTRRLEIFLDAVGKIRSGLTSIEF